MDGGNGHSLTGFDYRTAMQYVEHLKKRHTNIRTINGKIAGTRQYFNYQMEMGETLENPFTEILVKGDKTKKMMGNLLSGDELEDLYYSYPMTKDVRSQIVLADKRNKVMLGLMVYQGLSTTDMKRLRPEHLQPQKGKVYVPSGRIGGRRELILKPWQVIEIMEYLNTIWTELSKRKRSEALFPVSKGRLTDTVAHIIKKLKPINHKVKNIHQIRASVIVHWLSKYNLREVQVMAGHRRISTTERYLQEDIRELQQVIGMYHPLQ